MRICYDYQIFAAQKYGGISRYIIEIASRIHEYPDARVQIIAPLYRSLLLHEKRGRLPVVGAYFAGDFDRATGFCMKAGKLFNKAISGFYRPEIVHETYYSPIQTLRSGTKTVLTVHDTVAELFPDPSSRKPGPLPLRQVAFDRADHLICISHNTQTDLVRIYNVDPAKVSVIPLASSIVPSSRPPISLPEPFFLYVGSRWGYKNFLGLARAYREVGLYKTHKLICFGGDEALTKNETRTLSELGIPLDRCDVVNGNDDLLSRYYAGAVAVIYPSFYEGFGIPPLEAMGCSCPVLCSNSSSMPEVAGDAAIYFDPHDSSSIADALLKVANSSQERERLIQKGRERSRQFSWDSCARETYAVYERLLAAE